MGKLIDGYISVLIASAMMSRWAELNIPPDQARYFIMGLGGLS